MAQATKPQALKILMLHGFTNTGAIFHAKTRALEKAIQKSFPGSSLVYLDGPHRLRPSEIPMYPGQSAPDPRSQEPDDAEVDSFAWWRRKDPPASGGQHVVYAGIDEGMARVAEAVRAHGPFDGVIGFSQGACAASVVTALLERGRREAMERARAADACRMAYPSSFLRGAGTSTGAAAAGAGAEAGQREEQGEAIQPPLRFAVIYSGFQATPPVYGALYEPRLTTPSLHVIGSLDTIVDEGRSRALADRCVDSHVLLHPGGHFCPSTRDHLDGVLGFIAAAVHGSAQGQGQGQGQGAAAASKRGLGEQRAEDMDMPF